MPNINNPAGRLHLLLTEAMKQNGNAEAGKVWSHLLNVPETDRSQLLWSLGQVLLLPSLVRTQIERIPDINHAPYLVWLPKVENMFGIFNLQTHWQNIIKNLDDTVFHGLAICDEVLSRVQPEKVFDEKELASIQTTTRELIDEVRQSDLPQMLTSYMLRHLDMVDRAIQDSVVPS